MPDIQLGCHTIRSHGTSVARLHMYDWIILLFLAIVDGVLNIIEPFHRFVGRDMMTDLRYPLKGNTIPFWAVPLIAIVLPWVVFGGIYFKKKNVYDLHHGILGILYSVLITAVITDAIKDGVGRPRPDFFWRCFPDGIPKFDNVTTDVICHGEKSVIKEGHKSFPSGHSSWSFAGLGFLAWYLAAIWPHAHLQQLVESRSNGNENSYNMGWAETEASHQGVGAVALRDTSPILDSMESGRRL
uniref:Phosphatidic acid phosphatase type 2/haloperoxidase domain-containing protein n=1 Tax=Oryza punctata TaxID=4537 RepID=A0A0E0LU62_ORYPU